MTIKTQKTTQAPSIKRRPPTFLFSLASGLLHDNLQGRSPTPAAPQMRVSSSSQRHLLLGSRRRQREALHAERPEDSFTVR